MVKVIRHRELFFAQGRLTLTTDVPVLSSDVTGATTIYYTPYSGDLVSIYSGSEFLSVLFVEMSQTLADGTKSPAAAVADSLYDMFVWNDAGTLRCTRGPAWTNATTRGAGVGTTELTRVKGVLLNANTIDNGPVTERGTYVGTIATLAGAAQVNMVFLPAAAAGGPNAYLGVWNHFNRVPVSCTAITSDDSWEYSTATLRAMNDSASNRVTFVVGRSEGSISARAVQMARNTNADVTVIGAIGYDATGAIADGCLTARAETTLANTYVSLVSVLSRPAILGRHFVTPLEYSEAVVTTTWAGDAGSPTTTQCGLTLELEM
jgi:maltoporin